MTTRPCHTFARPEPNGASRGQILVLFAFFSVAMIGVLGLATDLGIAYAGHRSVQNAADAAALAGARAVSESVATPTIKAGSDVAALTALNGFVFATSGVSVESCRYVNDADTDQGSCDGTVPTAATGVIVTVAETHPTYFIRVVPGAPDTVTTRASATAHVMLPSNLAGSGPFIPCATNAVLASGGTMNILNQVSGVWQINPSAIGQTFNIHEPNPHDFNNCGIKSSQYKGIADQTANANLTAPPATYFTYATGTVASVRTSVQGIQGCQAGQTLNNCVAFLPIAVQDGVHLPIETGSNKKLWTVGFAAFLITQTSANSHTGTLLSDYIVKGPAVSGWTHQHFGPIAIKLTG